MLEKHFTILNKEKTRDGQVSLNPAELREINQFRKYSREQQFRILNTFNDTQKFNHKYYRGRFE